MIIIVKLFNKLFQTSEKWKVRLTCTNNLTVGKSI